jgi:two-component system alkaline phosphatase synthesis response regulator PhoP
VIVAYEGNEGLRKAREENPNLVLLDIIMPVKDGFSAAEQFKIDPQLSEIPVVMLTSYSARRAGTSIPVSRGLELEAEDYIEKPISPERLLNLVEKYLKTLPS